MDFSLQQCLDCPLPITAVLPALLIGIALAAAGAYLFTKHHLVVRNLGRLLLVLTAFLYLFSSLGLWRFGVAWNRNSSRVNRVADVALLLCWYLVTAIAIASVSHWKRSGDRPAVFRVAGPRR